MYIESLICVLLAFVTLNIGKTEAQCYPGFWFQPTSKVLIVAAEDEIRTSDVQSYLNGTSSFSSVDVFDIRSSTPSVAHLSEYHAILVFFDYPANDTELLGDNLASYYNAGGGVVVALFANAHFQNVTNKLPIQGAWGNLSNGYVLTDYQTALVSDGTDIGVVNEISSPLLNGFVSLSARWQGTGVVINNAVTVASWVYSKRPLILRGSRGNRTLVELNFYPPSSASYNEGWIGSGAVIIRNALWFSRCAACSIGSYSPNGNFSKQSRLLIVNIQVDTG